MVNEVNRLIFNALVSGHEVYIAALGTLYIARHEATKLRRNRVEAPSFSLMFTTECRGEALSSIILQTAGISSSADCFLQYSDLCEPSSFPGSNALFLRKPTNLFSVFQAVPY